MLYINTRTGTRADMRPIFSRSNNAKAIDGFKLALENTQLLFKGNSPPQSDATTNAAESESPRGALKPVLDVLKTNLRTNWPIKSFISDVKKAAYEVQQRQKINDHAFKLFWNLYTIAHQPLSRRSSMGTIGQIEGQIGQACDAILHAFHSHPFAVLPGEDSKINHSTLAVLNRDDESAAKYEKFARKIGEAWVNDRIPQGTAQVRELSSLQALLFELVWSGLVEQLKIHSAYSSGDPEQAEFQQKLVELERGLQEAILRSKKQHFTIAFCGMVKAGKSLFLNALVGRGILPSDGGFDAARPLLY
jgi:hypothetical protein